MSNERITFSGRFMASRLTRKMNDCAAIILAAGKGTRMKSDLCKVLHNVAGRPLISYVVDTVREAGLNHTVVVVGHQADGVKDVLAGTAVQFALQREQLGTAHAVDAARSVMQDYGGTVLILCGDVPLVSAETINRLRNFHEERRSRLTVATAVIPEPFGYGRIERGPDGTVTGIIEQADADARQAAIREVNTGIFLAEARLLFDLISRVRRDNANDEYYLTDVVKEAVRDGLVVHGCRIEEAGEIMGVNTRMDLAVAARIVWDRIAAHLMASGVTILDPRTVYIDWGVQVGADTILYPGVHLLGRTTIGRDCVVEPGTVIRDCEIHDRVTILNGSRLQSSVVRSEVSIGPMAHLRPGSDIGMKAKIGNFVEVKKTSMGDGSKASHLTYLGDSIIGKDVNIGCGTITCNYDGRVKHTTRIHDRCFVGSDVQFIAPVEIGEGALIGAGSTITRDVAPGTLAVSRAPQKSFPLRRGQRAPAEDEDRNP